MISLINRLHQNVIYQRRIRVLTDRLAASIGAVGGDLLDVGCGDGKLSKKIQEAIPALNITGIDVLVRPESFINVISFDGERFPFADRSFDYVLFVDVLHHCLDPMVLLREADRVARKSIIIKDHRLEGFLSGPALRFMDHVGNARHGVALPYNYWRSSQWDTAFRELGWTVASYETKLGLYPIGLSWVFDRSLHFIARVDKPST